MVWESISPETLRSALLQEPSLTGSYIERGTGDAVLTSAAILFPVINHRQYLTALFTRRTASLKDHPGQISFPGGRAETEDSSPAQTALRETYEEIRLPASTVEIMGYLPEYQTITGYRITPVIGLITPPLELTLNQNEVAEIFEAPLSFILNPANHQQHQVTYPDGVRRFHAISYHEHFIWGATAGIIVTLSRRLSTNS